MSKGVNKISIVIYIYRVSRWFYKRKLFLFAKVCYAMNYICFNCVVPPTADLAEGVNIGHSVGIIIHHEAIIGKNTKIFQNVTIGGGRRKIGEGCLIGAGAVVLADLGDYVRVGANCVVTKPIPDFSTVVGIPGKIIACGGINDSLI